MRRRAFAKMRDANEPDIVEALERVGAKVVRLDTPVDLLVGWRGQNWLLEVKNGEKAPAARPLTPDEHRFFATWPSGVYVVRCVQEALCVVGAGECPGRLCGCGCGGIADPAWFTQTRAAKLAARRRRSA